MKTDRAPLLDYKHLRAGQVYRVRRAFLDAEDSEHRVGEEWTYLTHRDTESGDAVTLFVRDDEGRRQAIPLRSNPERPDDILDRLHNYVSRRSELPLEHQFLCYCELGRADWVEVYGSSRDRVIECFGCGMVLTVHPIPGGSRLIALDDEAREAARQVSRLPSHPRFEDLLHAAVEHRAFPANVMVGAMLARRPNLEDEFAAALASDTRSLRLVALEFVSQMQQVPEGLEPCIVRALRSPLDPDPQGDETRWALEALLNVADRVTGFRSEIAELRRALRQYKTEEAHRARTLVLAILTKMDERIHHAEDEREAAIAVLRKLCVEEAFEQADEWLDQWAEAHRDGNELVARANLAEAAGDGLTEEYPEAAKWLHQRALDLFERYAAGKLSGEATARARHVRRVGHKLGRPPSTMPPPPEHHAVLAPHALSSPSLPSLGDASDGLDAVPPKPSIVPDALAPEIEVTGEIAVEEIDMVAEPTKVATPARLPPRPAPSVPPRPTPKTKPPPPPSSKKSGPGSS